MLTLFMAKTAVLSNEGILNGICVPSLMAAKPGRRAEYGKVTLR